MARTVTKSCNWCQASFERLSTARGKYCSKACKTAFGNLKSTEWRQANIEHVRARDRETQANLRLTDREAYNKRRRDERALKPGQVKLRDRSYHLAKSYGLTIKELQDIELRQADCCPICKHALDPRGTAGYGPHIDHDHLTGYVRGVTCRYCNIGLGNFKDSIATLHAAIRYLEQSSFRQDVASVLRGY